MPFYRINDPENEYFNQIGMHEDTVVVGDGLHMHYIRMSDNMVVGFLSHQITSAIPSVLFLDIDGVCNSSEFVTSPRNKKIGGMIGIDPLPAVLVKMLVQDTGCLVVLSSTWRLNAMTRQDVREQVIDFIDITPDFYDKPRGAEIQDWLDKHPEVTCYAILDDDSDMLDSQLPNFFKTTWAEGLTREIADKVKEHLNRV